MGKVHIHGGVFVAHEPGVTWDISSSSPMTSDGGQDKEEHTHHLVGQADDSYPLAEYWDNVETIAGLQAMSVAGDENDDEQHIQVDAYGVELPETRDRTAKKERHMNIKDLFNRERRQAETAFSPLGIVNEDGTQFKLVFPPGDIGKRLIEKLVDISFIMPAATVRYAWNAEQIVSASNILPCPVHTSPLLLTLIREKGATRRFSDAITVLARLHIARIAIAEKDTENPEHKTRCDKLRKILEQYVAAEFYRTLDEIVELGNVPQEERAEKDARRYFGQLIERFAHACDVYSLAMIHVQEWVICDMLRVPYSLRAPLFTPQMFPPAGAVFSNNGESFGVLRVNLGNYLRNRNTIYCGHYSKPDPVTKKETYLGIHPEAWNPMHLDEAPRLEDRLALLGNWTADTPKLVPNASRCMFGIHNDWIDNHTLREYMLLLSKDTRPGPVRAMKPVRTEEEEDAEKEQQQQAPEKMDTGEDEDFVIPELMKTK